MKRKITPAKAAEILGSRKVLGAYRAKLLARLYAAAVEALGNEEKAADWLKTPNRALRGARPVDRLDSHLDVHKVEDILGRITYGVYS
jgi:putative toxin-antitoxin system antitoxin component (TIGR02293 family)